MKSIIIGEGANCPKCQKIMDRRAHKPEWKPKENRYWYVYWDKCERCRFIQHYKENLVFPNEKEFTSKGVNMSEEIKIESEAPQESAIVIQKEAKIAKIPVKYQNGMVHFENLDEAARFAQCVLASGMAPKTMTSAAAILIAMQYGAEVGLKPMQAIQNIAVINGKPGLYGKALPGVVQSTGLLELFEEWHEGKPIDDDWKAVCKVIRRGSDELEKRTRVESFSWAQAKKSGLDKKSGPWQQYPDLMLRYRARGLAFNTLFADVLCGFEVAEVLQDIPVRRPDNVEEEDLKIGKE